MSANLIFDLSIGLGNDAMQTPAEVADALIQLAGRLRNDVAFPPDVSLLPDGVIRDVNGNTVGRWSLLYE